MLSDVILYLPEANALSDTILINIINNVIDVQIPDGQSMPIDDDIYYSEDLCKSLKAAALLNSGKFITDGGARRREKVGDVEVENFENVATFAWDKYIKSLADICPYLPGGGYSPSKAIGAKINPSDKFIIDDCPNCFNGCVGTCTCSAAESILKPCSTSTKTYF